MLYQSILHLAGAVTLLLWAIRMVRTGIERSQAPRLTVMLRESQGSTLRAACIGLGLAVMLQSSTAVALLAAGFASSGSLAATTGIALLLGADLGSAVVVQALSFDLSMLIPILLVAGGLTFLRGASRTWKQAGRVLIGVALTLVALGMIRSASEPLRDVGQLQTIVAYLSNDLVSAFIVGALFTWLIHSSIASVLLLAALSGSGNVPGELGVALVAGANLGAGLIALGLTHQGHIESRRIVAANLLVRGALALVVLAFLLWVPLAFAWLGSETPRQVVNAHLLFNVVVLAIGVPCAGPLGRLMSRVLKLRGTTLDAERHALEATRLDASLMGAPALALASATRELLRMAEVVERMLIPLMDIYETGDPEKIREAKRLEAAVDRAQSEIKLYLARVDYGGDDDLRQGRDLSAIAINFEYVGDAIAKTLLKLAQARYQRSLQFSAAGWRELTELHQRVVSNMRLAQHVLVSRDMQTARQLLDEKTMMDAAERASQLSHLERLQEGAAASLQTSNIHLETIRALKTINSLVASVAYLVVREQTATIGDAANGRVLA